MTCGCGGARAAGRCAAEHAGGRGVCEVHHRGENRGLWPYRRYQWEESIGCTEVSLGVNGRGQSGAGSAQKYIQYALYKAANHIVARRKGYSQNSKNADERETGRAHFRACSDTHIARCTAILTAARSARLRELRHHAGGHWAERACRHLRAQTAKSQFSCLASTRSPPLPAAALACSRVADPSDSFPRQRLLSRSESVQDGSDGSSRGRLVPEHSPACHADPPPSFPLSC